MRFKKINRGLELHLHLQPKWENSDTFLRLKEVDPNIVGLMMPFRESFENVNQEIGHKIVDPTDVPVDSVLGYWNIQRRHYPIRSSVFWHNIQWLRVITMDPWYQFLRNGWNRTICISKPIFSLLYDESVMRYLTVSIYFFTYTVKAQSTDQRI